MMASPVGAVPRTDGNLAALGNTCLDEEKPKLFDAFCHICICKGIALVITECFLIPLLADGILQCFQIMFNRYMFLGHIRSSFGGNLADMVFQDFVGWERHGAVVVALHLVERHVLVAHKFQHAPEVGLLLIASEEFHFAVA